MTIGFALVVIDLLVQLRYGRRVRRDPWQATTLEWAMPIPPQPYAFASIPHVDAAADRVAPGELAPSLARGEGYLGFTRNGWQETLGVHMTTGAPDQLIVLPQPTYLPLCTALATAARCWRSCSSSTCCRSPRRWWSPACSCSAAQSAGLARDYGPLPVGRGVSVPPHTEVAGAPPWLALIFTLVADGTLFTSLVFGTFYLWIAAPNWPAAVTPEPNLLLALGADRGARRRRGGGARIAAGTRRRRHAAGLDRPGRCSRSSRAIAAVRGLIGGVVPHPREHALGATAAALLGYVAVHAGIGLLFLAQQPAAPRRRLRLAAAVDWTCA